jgi:hypothetical protein
MSRNKKPRKAYRPKPVIQNPLVFLQPAVQADQTRLLNRAYSALDCMVNGKDPRPEEWRDCADVVNVIETMALHTGQLAADEVRDDVLTASESMRAAERRFKAGQGLRLDGPGIQAMREVLDVYAQALGGLTAMEMERVFAETRHQVAQRVREGYEVVSI